VSALALSSLVAGAVSAAEISGAGATFPYPIYAKWADAYKKETGIGLNYQSIGSGGGIQQIRTRTVTFGASDMPLEPKELEALDCVQFPTVMGGVIPVVNLPDVKPGEMVLDGPTLAKIYLGEIKKWNDPAIAKLNPTMKLPSTAIAVVERSDGSGTTFIFTNYLSKVSPEWKAKVGSSTSVQWPAGIGAKGNEGVAGQTKQIPGAIGYVEYSYVQQNHMTYTKLVNKDGNAVDPVASAFEAAAADADWLGTPGFGVLLTNQPGAESWPIAGATFILFPRNPKDPAAAKEALKFFSWAYAHGGKMAEELGYLPMPEKVQAAVRQSWAKEIRGPGGKPLPMK
jgi:phosphate transport system substrate-binding protein